MGLGGKGGVRVMEMTGKYLMRREGELRLRVRIEVKGRRREEEVEALW